MAIWAADVCSRVARQLICIEPTGLRLRHIGKTDPQCGTVQFCFHSGRLTCSACTGFRAVTTRLVFKQAVHTNATITTIGGKNNAGWRSSEELFSRLFSPHRLTFTDSFYAFHHSGRQITTLMALPTTAALIPSSPVAKQDLWPLGAVVKFSALSS